MTKENTITVYLDNHDYQNLEEMAEKERMAKSALARKILVRQIEEAERNGYFE